jgi:hypothetical protein
MDAKMYIHSVKRKKQSVLIGISHKGVHYENER